MTQFTSYSALLLKFIEPLMNGEEDEAEFLLKAKVGMIAWNYCISDEKQLPLDGGMKLILKKITAIYPDAKEKLNMLAIRKSMLFAEHNQIIVNVEVKTKPDGCKTLFVESAPADKIK